MSLEILVTLQAPTLFQDYQKPSLRNPDSLVWLYTSFSVHFDKWQLLLKSNLDPTLFPDSLQPKLFLSSLWPYVRCKEQVSAHWLNQILNAAVIFPRLHRCVPFLLLNIVLAHVNKITGHICWRYFVFFCSYC